MTATRRPHEAGDHPSRDELDAQLRAEGLDPTWWSNGPGAVYAPHEHSYHKVLVCQSGSITFHVEGTDVALNPGDRFDLPPGTPHGATVGSHGVVCIEAAR